MPMREHAATPVDQGASCPTFPPESSPLAPALPLPLDFDPPLANTCRPKIRDGKPLPPNPPPPHTPQPPSSRVAESPAISPAPPMNLSRRCTRAARFRSPAASCLVNHTLDATWISRCMSYVLPSARTLKNE